MTKNPLFCLCVLSPCVFVFGLQKVMSQANKPNMDEMLKKTENDKVCTHIHALV